MAIVRDKVSGLLLLDKPLGLSSNKALQNVKHLINAKKAGHTGSLDPLATGLLPMCFGESTKLTSYLLDADKTYVTTFKLGQTTTTGDLEGDITQTRSVSLTEQRLLDNLNAMTGAIQQIPPMYSALKKDGKPLYELARQGIEIEREPRNVVIHKLELLKFINDEIQLTTTVSSGFYIRSLAYDLGEALGCGAHVIKLRRTAVGDLDIQQAVTLEQLSAISEISERQQLLQRADQVLKHMVCIELNAEQAKMLFQGQYVMMSGLPSKGLARIYLDTTNEFLGVGLVNQGQSIKAKRLINPDTLTQV